MPRLLMKSTLLCGAVALCLTSAVACSSSAGSNAGNSTTTTPGAAASPSASLARLVPSDIRAAGVINGGSNFNGKPLDFYGPGNNPEGAMVDVLTEAAARLGLRIQWTQIAYSGLIPALQSGRIDVSGAQISSSPASQSLVNFLAFYEGSSSLLVPKGKSYTTPLAMCGLTIGLTTGSAADAATVKSINSKCTAAGKSTIRVLDYPSLAAADTALRSGRLAAFMQGTPQLLAAAQADPSLTVTLQGELGPRETGVAFAKKDLALSTAFQQAIDSMIADGSYGKILAKWSLSSIAIKAAHVNNQIVVPGN